MVCEVTGNPTTFAVWVLAPPGRQKEPERSVRFQLIRWYFLQLQVSIFEQTVTIWQCAFQSCFEGEKWAYNKFMQSPLKVSFHRKFMRNIHFPSTCPHSHTPNLLCCKVICSKHTNSASFGGSTSLQKKLPPWPRIVLKHIMKKKHQNVVKIALVVFLCWGMSNGNTKIC